jgi:hypothetical protein
MSRWFRHYAGMARDEKIVRAALRAKQPIERTAWVWAAILESAAELDDGGRFELDAAEVAYFLRADESDIASILAALEDGGRIAGDRVVKWSDRQFQSDRSAERQRRHREKQKAERDVDREQSDGAGEHNGDDDVTSASRHGDAPETETETETEPDKPSLRSGSARAARSDGRKVSPSKGTRLPSDWRPSEADVEYAISRGVPRDKVPVIAEEFRNYWTARPGKDGVKLDWPATWRNRVLQVCEHKGWAPKAQGPPIPSQAWVTADDPRWPMLAERYRSEKGKPPPITPGKNGNTGHGWHFPPDWLVPH